MAALLEVASAAAAAAMAALWATWVVEVVAAVVVAANSTSPMFVDPSPLASQKRDHIDIPPTATIQRRLARSEGSLPSSW
jgi:hypothetical protein